MPLVVLLGLVGYLLLSKNESSRPTSVTSAPAEASPAMAQPVGPIAATPNLPSPTTSDAGEVILGPGGSQTPLGQSSVATATAWDIGAQLTKAANEQEEVGTMVQGPLRWDPMSRSWY